MKTFKSIMSWIMPIVLGLLIAELVRVFLFTPVKVDGSSMYPNLQSSEYVALLKQAKIKRDSVVVFHAYGVDHQNLTLDKDTKYVKRVIALPGDRVEYKNNGDLYVNGKFQSQSYITKAQQKQGTLELASSLNAAPAVHLGTGQSFKVPAGKYFMLGDNRAESNDSRYYGFVPRGKILGVVKVAVWNNKRNAINSFATN
ncbi:signal peptidase I [Ligilactobacillus pabuli]|uniref:Signal peptidase I n=1 Tax=Ligilactobacillus pabuli TaxID=2886039 RepID=A0ABQ5JEC5_9LACO|nr:signal peptidase I [Ligilactobacillus pabuli]GKS80419.1 signal peptidase I [Ligilactobacillus pabuli]